MQPSFAERRQPPSSHVRPAASRVAELREELDALRRERDRYRELMSRDPLTGLYGRRHFEDRLEHEWRRALHFWTPLSLVAVNAGEGCADVEAVRGLGEMLGARARDIDIACRVGPASFAVILPGTGRIGAEGELRRLERFGRDLRTTPSFGLAVAFDDAHTPLELLIAADETAIASACTHLDDFDDDRHETIPAPSGGAPPAIR